MYFYEYSYLLGIIFLKAQFLTTATNDYCNGLYWNYPGYPECRPRMAWVHHNNGGSWCSIQKYLSNEEGKCPDPDYWDMSTYGQSNPNGSKTFIVYRAIDSHKLNAHQLLNVNAGNLGGVLAYLHTEVVPTYMRGAGGTEWRDHTRKFGIDSVFVFRVNIKAPPGHHHHHPDRVWGGYGAMDKGRCTAHRACDFEAKGAYLPGSQTQIGNPRHNYQNAKWYSFPACGYCPKPSGAKHCTFNYELLGKISLDDIVGINEGFYEFSKRGGLEDQLPFWENPYDQRLNAARIDRLGKAYINASIRRAGTRPGIKICPPQASGIHSLQKDTQTRINGNIAFLIIIVIILTFVVCYLCMKTKIWTKPMFQNTEDQFKRQINGQTSLPCTQSSDYAFAFVVITFSAISIILATLYLSKGSIFLLVFALITITLNLIYICKKSGLLSSIIYRQKPQRMKNQMILPLIEVKNCTNTELL